MVRQRNKFCRDRKTVEREREDESAANERRTRDRVPVHPSTSAALRRPLGAAVKSAKHLMLRTMGQVRLTFEELTTILVGIDAILNSRPIVAVTEDPNDGVALTPGHLLIGSSLKALPDVGELGSKESSLKRFRVTVIAQGTLLGCVATGLCERPTSSHQVAVPRRQHQSGRSRHRPRGQSSTTEVARWQSSRGRGQRRRKIRVASVKTANGMYRRPIHKLAVLPHEDLQDQ